LRKLRCCVF